MSEHVHRLLSIARGMDRYGDDGSITDRLLEAAAELERLQTLEAALPKTADGVPITQGMTVYVVGYREEPVEVAVEEMRLYEGGDWWLDGSGVYPSWQPQFCYSTLEAARKGGA